MTLSQIGNIGGEPYWRWYGFNGRVEWCATFVSWVANECGYIDTGVIPKFASCRVGAQWFKDRGQWQDSGYTVLFDNVSEVLHDRIRLSDVPKMTERDYTVRGCTALIDVIGGAVHHIGNIHKYARPEDVPEHTMFVITTDGMENASQRYSSDEVKKMIERQKAKYGWEFLFIGANIDAVETAKHFGIGADRAVNYTADSRGTEVLFDTVSETVCCMRQSQPISADWSKKIDEDFNNHK